jgi:hypothetical protein
LINLSNTTMATQKPDIHFVGTYTRYSSKLVSLHVLLRSGADPVQVGRVEWRLSWSISKYPILVNL